MVYTVEQITQCILPVAQKYGLKAVYLFGSMPAARQPNPAILTF